MMPDAFHNGRPDPSKPWMLVSYSTLRLEHGNIDQSNYLGAGIVYENRNQAGDEDSQERITLNNDGVTVVSKAISDDPLITLGYDGSVTATEFIGDGSKLTGLPTPDMDEYARLDGSGT